MTLRLHYAVCHYAKCNYAVCHYDGVTFLDHNTEGHLLRLSIIILIAVLLRDMCHTWLKMEPQEPPPHPAWENCSCSEKVKFITDQSNVQHVNIAINTIKNESINI
jgi:hypothetical protein